MRSLLLSLLVLGLCGVSQVAALPLSSKEISLMLRSGYSNPSVMQELAKRHFAETLDADKENALLKVGASEDLVSALKNGVYAVPAKEVTQMQEQLARQTVRSSMQAERARKADSAFQAQVARERNATRVPAAAVNAVYESVKGDLVRCNNGSLVHADDEAIAGKKLIALYFSANWCAPCRKFTPELIDFYNRAAPQHPEFEVLFVSYDRTAFAMQTYMRETKMPWPALDYAKIGGNETIKKYSRSGIPCLVLIDAEGKVLSDSYAGTEYLGPQKVLADLNALLTAGPAPHVAQSR